VRICQAHQSQPCLAAPPSTSSSHNCCWRRNQTAFLAAPTPIEQQQPRLRGGRRQTHARSPQSAHSGCCRSVFHLLFRALARSHAPAISDKRAVHLMRQSVTERVAAARAETSHSLSQRASRKRSHCGSLRCDHPMESRVGGRSTGLFNWLYRVPHQLDQLKASCANAPLIDAFRIRSSR
jgi:hypothetical protein